MKKTINRIMNSYIQFFKIKNLNVQIVLTDDMYTCQKNMDLIKKTLRLLMRQLPAKLEACGCLYEISKAYERAVYTDF